MLSLLTIVMIRTIKLPDLTQSSVSYERFYMRESKKGTHKVLAVRTILYEHENWVPIQGDLSRIHASDVKTTMCIRIQTRGYTSRIIYFSQFQDKRSGVWVA